MTQQKSKTKTIQQPQIDYTLFPNNTFKVSIKGELNAESQEIIQRLIDQAELQRQSQSFQQERETKSKNQIDSIVLCFAGCIFCGMVFLTAVVVSNVSTWLNQTQQVNK